MSWAVGVVAGWQVDGVGGKRRRCRCPTGTPLAALNRPAGSSFHSRATILLSCGPTPPTHHLYPPPCRYFGRDSLIAARLMMSRLASEATEGALRAVLGEGERCGCHRV